jgi:hypothetical protein
MKRTILFALVAVVSLTMVDVASAQIFGGRRRARVTYAPAPAATVAQGQAAAGYRTYSYEPTMSAPVYRSYAPSYRSPARTPPHLNAGRHSAGYKLTDF